MCILKNYKIIKTVMPKSSRIIHRLSIQISPEQREMLTNYVKLHFKETGVILSHSAIIRNCLSTFLTKFNEK